MEMSRKRVAISIIGIAVSCLLWWIGGYDFDARGDAAITLALTIIFIIFIAWTFPMGG